MKKLLIYSLGKGLFRFEITEPNQNEPETSVNILHTFFNFGKVDLIFHNSSMKIEHPDFVEEIDFSQIELWAMYGNPVIPNSLEEVVVFLKERGFGCCFEPIVEEPELLPIKVAGFVNQEGQKEYYNEPQTILVDGVLSYEFPLQGDKITNTDGFDYTNEGKVFLFLNNNGIGEEREIYLNADSIVIINNIL